MTVGFFQGQGSLPIDRDPVDADWTGLEYLWEPIDPDVLIKDHPGADRCTVLTVAPSDYTRYETRGTVDIQGVTGVEGPKTIDKGCDYIAALARKYPDKFIGMAAVNPKYRGVKAAVAELERAVTKLRLTGLKLYPMYDHYAVNDRDLAYPIFAKAQELDIPVMIHLSTTPVTDTVLMYGWPALLNDVAGEDEPTIPETDMARMLGGNYARFIGIDWSQQQTVEQMRGLEESWRQTIKEKKVR